MLLNNWPWAKKLMEKAKVNSDEATQRSRKKLLWATAGIKRSHALYLSICRLVGLSVWLCAMSVWSMKVERKKGNENQWTELQGWREVECLWVVSEEEDSTYLAMPLTREASDITFRNEKLTSVVLWLFKIQREQAVDGVFQRWRRQYRLYS